MRYQDDNIMKTLSLTDDEFDWLDLVLWSVYIELRDSKESVPPHGVFLFKDALEIVRDLGRNHFGGGFEDWPSFLHFCNTGRYPG